MEENKRFELQFIRDELIQTNETVTTTLNYSVGGIILILGWLIQSHDPVFWSYFLPFFIIIPSAYIITSRIQTSSRLVAYQMVFLEDEDKGSLYYENKMQQFREKEKGKLRYSDTIFWLYAALGVMTTALFIANGKKLWWHFAFYILILFFYVRYYWIAIKKNWILIYKEIWENTKK